MRNHPGRPSRDERIRRNEVLIREAEQAIIDAGPDADLGRLQQRLGSYKAIRARLLHGHR